MRYGIIILSILLGLISAISSFTFKFILIVTILLLLIKSNKYLVLLLFLVININLLVNLLTNVNLVNIYILSISVMISLIYLIEIKKDIHALFSPIAIFVFYFLLNFVLFPFQLNKYGYYVSEKSLLIILMSIPIFYVGYILIKNKTTLKISSSILLRKNIYIKQLFLFILAVLLFSVLMIITGYTNIFSIFSNIYDFRIRSSSDGLQYIRVIIQGLISFTLCIIFYLGFVKKNSKKLIYKISFLIFLVVSSVLLMLYGNRGPLLMLFLALMIIQNYANRKIKFINLVPILLVVSLFFVIYGEFRGSTQGNYRYSINFDQGIDSMYDKLIDRFDSFRLYQTIVENIDNGTVSTYKGTTYWGLLLQPIPRSLFPDKPLLIGVLATKLFLPDVFAKNVTYDPSIFGEFYLNFRELGIFIMFFVGGLIGFLQKCTELNYGNFLYLLYYSQIALFCGLILSTGINSIGLTDLILIVFIYFVLTKFIFKTSFSQFEKKVEEK